jgi:hypothetical protein
MRSTIRSFTTMLAEHGAPRRAVLFAVAVSLVSAPLRAWPIQEAAAAPPVHFDCNQNGIDDAVDIAVGSSGDVNGNGVPDECEALATAVGTESSCIDCALPSDAGVQSSANDDAILKTTEGGSLADPDASDRCTPEGAVDAKNAPPGCAMTISRRTEFAERRVQRLRRARGDPARPCTAVRSRRLPAPPAAPPATRQAGPKTLG